MGSSHYAPRHGAAARGRRGGTVRSAIRRPVVGGALAVAMLGSVGATVASGLPMHTGAPAALTSESEPVEEPTDESVAEDTARLSDERRTSNVSRSASREQDRRADLERKREAAARKKTEARRAAAAKKRAAEEKEAEEAAKPVSERDFTAKQLAEIRKDPKPYAIELMREHGWDDDQWGCLDSLWIGESDWEWDAKNPTSGAYGIPQSLPAKKMASVGDDWKTNPITQMTWGLEYIEDSYGSPCKAKSFWDKKDPHWY